MTNEPCDACSLRVNALEKRMLQMFADRDAQLKTTADLLTIRLHDSNNLQKQILNQQNILVTRREHDLFGDRIAKLEHARGLATGGYSVILTLIMVGTLILQIFVYGSHAH